jgi:hypothetical protein
LIAEFFMSISESNCRTHGRAGTAYRREPHPDLLPEHGDLVATTLADPDQVRSSKRFGSARLFSRWYPDLRSGKHVVVVVVSAPAEGRHWIVTAYIARRLAEGAVEWKRS